MSYRLLRIVTASLLLLLLATPVLRAQTGAQLVAPASPRPVPMAVAAPQGWQAEPGTAWHLVTSDRPGEGIPVQVSPALAADGTPAETRRLLAVLPATESNQEPRRFRLQRAEGSEAAAFAFRELNETSLGLFEGETPLWTYNYGLMTGQNVPADDPRRTRSSYLHPIWGLQGEILTGDFPADHFHHHGAFWAWPHVGIDGQEYDLWMGKNIGHRFVRWLHREAGPVAAVLAVENGWFVGERQVMVERVWMRSFRTSPSGRVLDLEFTWIPQERPISLLGAERKSYGGFSLRFADRENTVITVPQGPSAEDLPDTRLPWADLSATFAGAAQPSGAAILVDRNHPAFPPTWLTRHYGILCVGWPGVEPQTFPPGEPIRLRYRVWIHTGVADVAALEEASAAYQAACSARWE